MTMNDTVEVMSETESNWIPITAERLIEEFVFVEIEVVTGRVFKGFVSIKLAKALKFDIGGREKIYNILMALPVVKDGIVSYETQMVNVNAQHIITVVGHKYFNVKFQQALQGDMTYEHGGMVEVGKKRKG